MRYSGEELESYQKHFIARDRLGSFFSAKCVSLTADECIYEYQVHDSHMNPGGILHGGALFTVMDSSQGMLIHAILDPSFLAAATGTATIRYLAPVHSGKIRIRTVVKEIQNRKHYFTSTATDDNGVDVATLESVYIAMPLP